jgi:hypothetical protein
MDRVVVVVLALQEQMRRLPVGGMEGMDLVHQSQALQSLMQEVAVAELEALVAEEHLETQALAAPVAVEQVLYQQLSQLMALLTPAVAAAGVDIVEPPTAELEEMVVQAL